MTDQELAKLAGQALIELGERLRVIIQQAVREEITQALRTKEPKYYSRQEAALILKISLPTLGAWIKRGKIKAKKIGNRVLIEETELTK
jgi:excisionase family DNA binding protein